MDGRYFSPMTVAQSEDQVFASPMLGIALGDSSELQRKSCRMKIFGKAYLCSRSVLATERHLFSATIALHHV